MTRPDINTLNTKIAVIENKLDNIATKQDETIGILKAHIADETEYRKSQEDKFNLKADKSDVDALVDNQKWIVRLIVGIVVTAVVALVIKSNL